MKKIGFLSFGHWNASRQSAARSARDVLQQSIELAVAAEELGADGAYFRVHHFAQQLASPFPLLAAVGARTSRIEIGTAVIDGGGSDAITVTGASRAALTNFEVRNGLNGILAVNGAHVQLTDLNVHNNAVHGISLQTTSSAVLANVTTSSNGVHGLDLETGSSATVTGALTASLTVCSGSMSTGAR